MDTLDPPMKSFRVPNCITSVIIKSLLTCLIRGQFPLNELSQIHAENLGFVQCYFKDCFLYHWLASRTQMQGSSNKRA